MDDEVYEDFKTKLNLAHFWNDIKESEVEDWFKDFLLTYDTYLTDIKFEVIHVNIDTIESSIDITYSISGEKCYNSIIDLMFIIFNRERIRENTLRNLLK